MKDYNFRHRDTAGTKRSTFLICNAIPLFRTKYISHWAPFDDLHAIGKGKGERENYTTSA